MALLDGAVRRELLALYEETDALLKDHSCESSTDCCQFAKTGREPYPTPAEIALILDDAAKLGGLSTKPSKKKTSLPTLEVRRCPMLGQDGRCRIYASRPFGCRTFFCDRRVGPKKMPRAEILELSRRIADLSARAFPRDPRPRPLVRAIEDGPAALLRGR